MSRRCKTSVTPLGPPPPFPGISSGHGRRGGGWRESWEGRGRSHWEPVAPVGRSGAGRRRSKKTDQTLDNRRYTRLYPKRSKLRLKIGPQSRCSLSRCSGMELHHPIMSKLWDIGGRTKRKKKIITTFHIRVKNHTENKCIAHFTVAAQKK